MKLTRLERWVISNQLKMLEALYPDDVEFYAQKRKAIECGYEMHYSWACEHIYKDDSIMSIDECKEVLEILEMFDSITNSYSSIKDKSGIDKKDVKFPGFDGNSEGKYMSYARYFCSLDGGRFVSITKDTDLNSHFPTLTIYRRMLNEWNKSKNKFNLSKSEIIDIIKSRYTQKGEK